MGNEQEVGVDRLLASNVQVLLGDDDRDYKIENYEKEELMEEAYDRIGRGRGCRLEEMTQVQRPELWGSANEIQLGEMFVCPGKHLKSSTCQV